MFSSQGAAQAIGATGWCHVKSMAQKTWVLDHTQLWWAWPSHLLRLPGLWNGAAKTSPTYFDAASTSTTSQPVYPSIRLPIPSIHPFYLSIHQSYPSTGPSIPSIHPVYPSIHPLIPSTPSIHSFTHPSTITTTISILISLLSTFLVWPIFRSTKFHARTYYKGIRPEKNNEEKLYG